MPKLTPGEEPVRKYNIYEVNSKTGLWSHTRNAFGAVGALVMSIQEGEFEGELIQISLSELSKPLQNYEWWVHYQTRVKPDEAEGVLVNSNSERVQAFNALIDEFNQKRESIISDIKNPENRKFLEDFWKRAEALFKE